MPNKCDQCPLPILLIKANCVQITRVFVNKLIARLIHRARRKENTFSHKQNWNKKIVPNHCWPVKCTLTVRVVRQILFTVNLDFYCIH